MFGCKWSETNRGTNRALLGGGAPCGDTARLGSLPLSVHQPAMAAACPFPPLLKPVVLLTVLSVPSAGLPVVPDIQVDAGRTVGLLQHFWTSTGFW